MSNITCKLTIGTRHYGMRKMPPMKASGFALRVVSAISGLVADPNAVRALDEIQKLIKGQGGETNVSAAENLDIKNEDAIRVFLPIASLLSSLDAKEVDEIFKQALTEDVFVENDRLSDEDVFHRHFQQFTADYFPVAIWATWNNTKDFFGGIGDGMKALFRSSSQEAAPIQK